MRMSPYVRIVVPGFEWRSVHIEHGGHKVEWGPLAVMEYEILDPNLMARIEVLDHKGLL